jgi:hypothetical protein
MRVLEDIVFDQFHGSQIEYWMFSDELQEHKLPWSSSFDHHCYTLTSIVERQLLLS